MALLCAFDPDAGPALDAGPVPVVAEAQPFSLSATGAEQLVLVITDDWRSSHGTLKRMEKVGEQWLQVGPLVEVMVGDDGMGWGLGLHPLGAGEPRKVEGDARAPAGVFRLPSTFGHAPPTTKSDMPFLDAQGHVCVEDPRAPAYNRIVDGAADATLRGEALDRADGLYDVAILIDHNGLGSLDVEPRRGRGSCTFLHIWKRKGRSTAGGTAMARDDLDKIVDWLDPKRRPVLVQLPKRELIMKRGLWGIP